MEFTVPVYQDRLCVMVKRAEKVPLALIPLMIFDSQLWLYLVLVYFTIAFTWHILRFLNKNLTTSKTSQSLLQSSIDTAVLIFSSPYGSRFPKIQSERVLISSICLFSLIVVAAFQSSLSTIYTKPMYYKNIETLEELDESGKRINSKYKTFLDDAFPLNSSELIDRLAKKVVWIQNESMIYRIDKYHEAGLTRKIQFDLSYKSRNLHMISECPRKYRIAFVVPDNFYFLEEINRIFLRISEAGIVRKIIGLVSFTSNLQYSIKNPQAMKKTNFTLQDLQLGFYALLGGLTVSILVFAMESLWIFIVEKNLRRIGSKTCILKKLNPKFTKNQRFQKYIE